MSPYAKGYIDFLRGKGLEQNPYTDFANVNDSAIESWETGWKVASALLGGQEDYPSVKQQIVLN